jgi:hypothetical protein
MGDDLADTISMIAFREAVGNLVAYIEGQRYLRGPEWFDLAELTDTKTALEPAPPTHVDGLVTEERVELAARELSWADWLDTPDSQAPEAAHITKQTLHVADCYRVRARNALHSALQSGKPSPDTEKGR